MISLSALSYSGTEILNHVNVTNHCDSSVLCWCRPIYWRIHCWKYWLSLGDDHHWSSGYFLCSSVPLSQESTSTRRENCKKQNTLILSNLSTLQCLLKQAPFFSSLYLVPYQFINEMNSFSLILLCVVFYQSFALDCEFRTDPLQALWSWQGTGQISISNNAMNRLTDRQAGR